MHLTGDQHENFRVTWQLFFSACWYFGNKENTNFRLCGVCLFLTAIQHNSVLWFLEILKSDLEILAHINMVREKSG
jgi:hypothetical protein